jgi:hypothetical protein
MTFLNREGTSLFPKLDNDLSLDSVGTMGTMFNLLLERSIGTVGTAFVWWKLHSSILIWSRIKFRKF